MLSRLPIECPLLTPIFLNTPAVLNRNLSNGRNGGGPSCYIAVIELQGGGGLLTYNSAHINIITFIIYFDNFFEILLFAYYLAPGQVAKFGPGLKWLLFVVYTVG